MPAEGFESFGEAASPAFNPNDFVTVRILDENILAATRRGCEAHVLCIDPKIAFSRCDAILPVCGTVDMFSRLWQVFELPDATVRSVIDGVVQHRELHFPEELMRDLIMTV